MVQKIEILLVEDDKRMCEAFEFCIHRNPVFLLSGQTGKQSEGIELLKSGKIGVLILDLELEEGDGIHFLREMNTLDIDRPLVVVITNNRSDITLECVRATGADYIYQKSNESYSPDMVLDIIEQIYPFRSKRKNQKMDVISYRMSKEEEYQRRRIEEELLKLEFKMNVKSTAYLVEAIHYVTFELRGRECKTKEIYDYVAGKHNTKSVNVEKAIRDNIERTWVKTKPEILEKYYTYPVTGENGCPTNTEFIHNIAYKLRNM